MTDPKLDLEELIKRCKTGNSQAQYTLYHRYAEIMYNVSFRIVNDQAVAEDVVQSSFIQAFKNLNELKTNIYFPNWIKRIIINRSIDHLRKKRRLNIVSLDDEETFAVLPPETFVIFEDNQKDRLIEAVMNGIAQLSDGYRTVLTLHLLEGFDHQEIADILQISPSTSRSQYMRAKEKLRNLIIGNKNE